MIRRCSWEIGMRCHAPAAVRVTVTYLDVPTDRPVYVCREHAAELPRLVRPGWQLARLEGIVAS